MPAAALAWTSDRWIFRLLDPGAFDPAATPTAPDFSKPEAWSALPELADGATHALTYELRLDAEAFVLRLAKKRVESDEDERRNRDARQHDERGESHRDPTAQ